jgi:hypothetical protein
MSRAPPNSAAADSAGPGSPNLRIGQMFGVKAHSVIVYAQHYAALVAVQIDFDFVRLGVFAHVAEGFLNNPPEECRDQGRVVGRWPSQLNWLSTVGFKAQLAQLRGQRFRQGATRQRQAPTSRRVAVSGVATASRPSLARRAAAELRQGRWAEPRLPRPGRRECAGGRWRAPGRRGWC